ncbi:MAG: hypothetical protein A2854_01265 [Parcubacteria group bacterium RIFCSPHIGHO2_01_FULL_56_18]|nr:MAG: hypothetical protein A2854_01265 [Parcubacteria group bacterium RIFCSPHIGHO2_01_FULL_56_18]
MIIFLILGVLLGGITVLFFFQNIDPITVSFLFWHLDGSLAVILMIAFGSGILTTLLFLLPSFIRDEWQYRKLKKHARAVEAELAQAKSNMHAGAPEAQPATGHDA